jgi:diacylglycerol kinase family enzyme
LNRTGGKPIFLYFSFLAFMSSSINVIINNASGATDKAAAQRIVADVFKASGVDATFFLARGGAEIAELARNAVADPDCQTIVAGGGDGTIAAVAAAIMGTEKNLGVLPLGTFNYFARNLGISSDLEQAARIIVEGSVARVNVGEVNGKLFLNNASLGLYPAVLREREQVYKRWGRSRLAAYFSVALTMLRPTAFLKLRLAAEGGKQVRRRTPLVFVGNNKYQLEEFNIRGAACLDAGRLAFYITNPIGRIGLFRLAARGLLGRLDDAEGFEVACLCEARVETRRRRLRVAMDGEIMKMSTPLQFRVLPGALRVLVPTPARVEDEPAAAPDEKQEDAL